MILIIIIRLHGTPGDHQAELARTEFIQSEANSLLKTVLSIHAAVEVAYRAEKSVRSKILRNTSNQQSFLKLGLKKSAALLFAAKEELTAKDNELVR
jgi:hypothetical protein